MEELNNKEKKRERQKQWQTKNKERLKEYQKDYLLKNKERLKEYQKEYYVKNRNKIIEKEREWRTKNRDKKQEKERRWTARNKEKIKNKNVKYRFENLEKIKKQQREYYVKNREKRLKAQAERQRKRLKNDPTFKLKALIRRRFLLALKLHTENGKTKALKEYGIDIKAIVEKLGPMPNDGKEYHIDHIFPVSAFDLNNPEHIKLCWHPNNLQWLEASENMSKNNKYDKQLFEEYCKNHQTNCIKNL